MSLTTRGQAAALTVALLAGGAVGATAQLWNPYTRHLDSVSVQLAPGVEEDEAVCFGAREVAYEATSDGALVTCSTSPR